MPLLIDLYLTFVRIGFASFGGASSIALILDEMEAHQWMTAEDLSNLVGIAEMTPGPLGLNCATFCGLQTGGYAGSLMACLGVLTPCMTLTMLVAIFYQKFKTAKVMKWIMLVVKPICIAMVIKAALTLCFQNYFEDSVVSLSALDIPALLLGFASLYLINKKKWTVPKLILFAAIMGILFFGVGPLVIPGLPQ